jgi:hypothetical protein
LLIVFEQERNKMFRAILCAAALAGFMALAVPAPAKASMLDPGLATATSSKIVQDAQYWPYRPYGYPPYGYQPRHRVCWYERVRVRWHDRWVWRSVRRCGWRYYGY